MLVKLISRFNREYKYDIGLKDRGGRIKYESEIFVAFLRRKKYRCISIS
jgi:hypothetical protein